MPHALWMAVTFVMNRFLLVLITVLVLCAFHYDATFSPTDEPTAQPSNPTLSPTKAPTEEPSLSPTDPPTFAPTFPPTFPPTQSPSNRPTSRPSTKPSIKPSGRPSGQPSMRPSSKPSMRPTGRPSVRPSGKPSRKPSAQPTDSPTCCPSDAPSSQPSGAPTCKPSMMPSSQPSAQPSSSPTTEPSVGPTTQPSAQPTSGPSSFPSGQPSSQPSAIPSTTPSSQPSTQPSMVPSAVPSGQPTGDPTMQPSTYPSAQPSRQPSSQPSGQPTLTPTGSPTYVHEDWGQTRWDNRRRIRAVGGMCNNQCSGHGVCNANNVCKCFTSLAGDPDWTGIDCSDRACPYDIAWIGAVVDANNVHPRAECSNRGMCDRKTGECKCFPGYDGVACQRHECPDDCNGRGVCYPERHLAKHANAVYETPWDAAKSLGCVCDVGFRGLTCAEKECSTGPDPLGGFGNEAGRDCSGRGLCDYETGICHCFQGFFGERCQNRFTFS